MARKPLILAAFIVQGIYCALPASSLVWPRDRWQPRLMATPKAPIPIDYHGRQFPSRKALAEYLAPLVGQTPSTLMSKLSRNGGDVEGAIRAGIATRTNNAKAVVYQDQQFTSFAALAKHLAPQLGRAEATVKTLLSKYDGDVEQVIRFCTRRGPIVYQGQRFPSHIALAAYLAPLVGKSASTVRTLLSKLDGNIERVLAVPHRPQKRATRTAISGPKGISA